MTEYEILGYVTLASSIVLLGLSIYTLGEHNGAKRMYKQMRGGK